MVSYCLHIQVCFKRNQTVGPDFIDFRRRRERRDGDDDDDDDDAPGFGFVRVFVRVFFVRSSSSVWGCKKWSV